MKFLTKSLEEAQSWSVLQGFAAEVAPNFIQKQSQGPKEQWYLYSQEIQKLSAQHMGKINLEPIEKLFS